MNPRERENAVLSFRKPKERGPVEETFVPWDKTIRNWLKQGFPAEALTDAVNHHQRPEDVYLDCLFSRIINYERVLGYDPLMRLSFKLPFLNFEVEILEETDQYTIKRDADGWRRKYHKNQGIVEDLEPVVATPEDWFALKRRAEEELEKHYTLENIQRNYGPYQEDHAAGRYPIRLNFRGFFWAPRELMGIEKHLYAFYDAPEIMHDMNEFILKVYLENLARVLDVLPADVVYINEDLSGVNGPMISPKLFDEFIGAYYKRLIPVLKEKNVAHVFVDTDGDFAKLIPSFLETGVEGFLPLDVNGGVDIVAVRRQHPDLKLIGGFDKLAILKGRETIDREFERVLPVIRQGGYIPGIDHMAEPSTPFENYRYYLKKLKEIMQESGTDLR
ncbi:MAG: hypothetical protein GY866_06290 [Proteobacteria bacterium]|nr:hypothetical protein [Pseudomonadota bacterium]